ncbi:MAG: cobyrinate a,c-diamide synthase [Gammaproteobacteria bacterium]|nr:cobyrinate a,c-diamide synthase [Gammaproteobacteria bacterium]MDH3362790.1 cobyrinate a,c-diamide synthase [Gammaproteobacteria bacterium]MDH3481358.1 cobyrinate a,c-diamide synthase [Gammaproteobacteria bacterium]
MAHLLIAAAHKSSGKTSVAIGLAAEMLRRGLAVQPFKKGPDYIDPLWLGRAAGRPCYNLDFFTMSHTEIVTSFATRSAGADISLIEGNKGLFDGIDVEGSDSNAALAKMLSAPVVLVIDATGMTRGIAPLINGYLDFDRGVDVCGVIFNKVGGPRHEGKLRAALERYTDAEIIGAIGRDQALEIPERHLGLIPANEAEAVDATIRRLADAASAGMDVDRLIGIAGMAESAHMEPQIAGAPAAAKPDVRIAVARDAAFGFYYPDDLEAFEDAGAELLFFDALSDSELPAADGLFIGGGFPEMCLPALAANKSLRADIRQKLAAGMPAYAECGGLMYLARNIRWRGEKCEMVGAVPGDVIVEDRPQGRGYVMIEETGKGLWPAASRSTSHSGAGIPAHEFHYARLENLPADLDYAYRVIRGHGIDGHRDGLIVGNFLAGFVHHRNTEADPWVSRFVGFVREKSKIVCGYPA